MGIFGLVDESSNLSSIFLIHERDTEVVGKGANAVASYLYHILETNATYKDAQEICFQADNCVGQNKNNFIMGFLSWYSTISNIDSISINFMVASHGKFSPDRSFGVISNKFNHSNVDCLEDFVDIVNQCSNLVAIPTSYPEKGIDNVPLIDFKSFLKDFYKLKPIKDITKYHSFQFKKGSPGTVFIKMWSDSEEFEVNLLKPKSKIPKSIPNEYHLQRGELDNKRKLYLYEELRPFIHDDYKKDLFITNPHKKDTSVDISLPNSELSLSQTESLVHSSEINFMDSQVPSLVPSEESFSMDINKVPSLVPLEETFSMDLNQVPSLVPLEETFSMDLNQVPSLVPLEETFSMDVNQVPSLVPSEESILMDVNEVPRTLVPSEESFISLGIQPIDLSSSSSNKYEKIKRLHNKSSKQRCMTCDGCQKWISFKSKKVKKCRSCVSCVKYKRLCIQFLCKNVCNK